MARSDDCHYVCHQIAPLGGQKQISSPLYTNSVGSPYGAASPQ